MKKLYVIAFIIMVLSNFSCGKKKEQKPAINLENTAETTDIAQVDTVFSNNENIAFDSDTNKMNNAESTPTKHVKEYKFIPKGTTDFKATGDYRVQLISLTNYDKILSIKQKLKAAGYITTLSTIEKSGKVFYRLRLSDSYSKDAANEIGNEIKRKFKFITGYWIQKIN